MSVLATSLGYPRIGVARQLKRALEGYWNQKIDAAALLSKAAELRRENWRLMSEVGIDHIPLNDFSLYDHVLDAAVLFGAIPARYRRIKAPLAQYFAMARGAQDADLGLDLPALEMTKWFDTNYHYIVPELQPDQEFELNPDKLISELGEAQALGLKPRPVILGPVSFLSLSKLAPGAPEGDHSLDLLGRLLPAYIELLQVLADNGVEWVQLDEPCLVTDLDEVARQAYRFSFSALGAAQARPKLLLATYFGALADNQILATESGFEALHVDLVRAPGQLSGLLSSLPASMSLSLGLVSGRNIWKTDLDAAHERLRAAVSALGAARVWVGPSCSLLHVPVDLSAEEQLDEELRDWMSFARQKLWELKALADAAEEERPSAPLFAAQRESLSRRRRSARTEKREVRERVGAVTEAMLKRPEAYPVRARLQRERLALPPLPTTTIGSFPQTEALRGVRAAWRAGRIDRRRYNAFLCEETQRCVQLQERLGLDMLVHGEFERTDMVEYFGEQLDGFAFTSNGWVQSYGSRCVKPPVLYGDVARPRVMTLGWSAYAQSLTQRPMKGMLTGPVTILQWSFVRDDQPRSETCKQIALALRDEVRDLEAGGIAAIQVDEPAIREGLPLRQADWDEYLRWAVDAFRLATAVAKSDTQIHTHMCYSEFGDILDAIAEMDADVLSIETSRSNMELLSDFSAFKYENEIGPGVYDIHSPRVPSVEELLKLLERAAEVLPVRQLWVNPDCGLKTRGQAEVEAALMNMVEAARQARELLTR